MNSPNARLAAGLLAAAAFLVPATSMAAGAEHAVLTEIPFSVWFHAFNLTVMIGILVYFGRTPIRNYLVQRQDTVRSALKQAEEARAKAEAVAAEFKAKLQQLESEAASHRERVEKEAELEVERLIAGAKRHAIQITEQTDRLLQEELRTLREELRRESVEMALELAKSMVGEQISAADQDRLLTEYVNDVKSSEVN